jgi:hypothetical protein
MKWSMKRGIGYGLQGSGISGSPGNVCAKIGVDRPFLAKPKFRSKRSDLNILLERRRPALHSLGSCALKISIPALHVAVTQQFTPAFARSQRHESLRDAGFVWTIDSWSKRGAVSKPEQHEHAPEGHP